MRIVEQLDRSIRYTIVVAVFNRPEEMHELLASLARQSYKRFEVLVVEDGSSRPCDEVCRQWSHELSIRYIVQENTGPGGARNRGALHAECLGEYVLFFDSDCLIPGNYMKICDRLLLEHPEVDLFGGPDAWHPDFSGVQKAISYAMTSPFSTGGIRGGGERTDRFYPRTFNMGVRLSAFRAVGGFGSLRYGEDVDLSMRLVRAGYRSALFRDLFVYHKRRERFGKFFRQVHHSGAARVTLSDLHKGSLRLVHLLPSLGVIILIFAATFLCLPFSVAVFGLGLLYGLLIWVHSSVKFRSVRLGLLAVQACFVMVLGYGFGFLSGVLRRVRLPW